MCVRDQGRWRPVPDDNGHRGHGLRVIGMIADDLRIDRGDDGTQVRFVVRVPAAASDKAPVVRPARTAAREPGRPAAVHVVGDRVLVTGDLDLAGRDTAGPVLLDAVAAGARTVDLTDVPYLSSAGVALLAEASRLAGGGLSIVVAEGSAPARVCALTGLATAMTVHATDRSEGDAAVDADALPSRSG